MYTYILQLFGNKDKTNAKTGKWDYTENGENGGYRLL